jgi:hypothetical protein
MLKESIYLLTEYQIFNFPIPTHQLEQIFTDKGIKLLFCQHLKQPLTIYNSLTLPYYSDTKEYRSDLTHEAAHVMFHDSNYLFKNDIINIKTETQANAFAAYFLMPVHIFEEALKYGRNDYELSEEFGVSDEFVNFRKTLSAALLFDGYFKEKNTEVCYGESCSFICKKVQGY